MRYENELCQGCGLKFTQEDDAVVCPVCGTPQHRKCWQEHEGCVNASMHADGYIWHFSAAADKDKQEDGFNASTDIGAICAVCGTNNPAATEVCPVCKTKLNSEKPAENSREQPFTPFEINELPFLKNAGIAPDEVIGGVKANDIALYTQMGAKQYINKFRRLDNSGFKFSWNWAAFFFSPYWFFYRKLYWLGGIFLGLKLAVSITIAAFVQSSGAFDQLNTLLNSTSLTLKDYLASSSASMALLSKFSLVSLEILTILYFLIHIIAALLANQAYKKKITKELTSIRRFAKDENVFRMLTIRRGGASPLALLGSVLGYDLLLSMLKAISGWI